MQSFQGGGAERVTLDLINHLDRKVYEPSILVVNCFGELVPSIPRDLTIIEVLSKNEKMITHPIKVISAVIKAAREVDLIFGTLEMTPTYLASIASIITKKQAIGWIHTDVREYPKTNHLVHKFLIRTLYKRLKAIIAVSEGAKVSFEKMFPQIKVPVVRIYNPIRLDDIYKMAPEENDVEDTEPIIIGIGRLSEVKGFDHLIKAHHYLVKKGVKNKLLILGEGSQRKELEALILDLGVEESVTLKGFVENPYKYLRSASVFVLSSRYEGFSVVIAEALSLGIPVVSSNCHSGPSEILEDGKYGSLTPIGDYEALAIKIMETLHSVDLENNRKERIKRGQDFSLQKIIPEFERLFFLVLHNRQI
ncbi:glycosyltransferase [Cytobacillus luteolus]|nr:glycosyltransferase [Cytobacillus luteolus]MBP1943292.1 glycosyltransferase involved in cell wall biosynthesis [Cytobacillus luteolus]